MTDKLDAVSVVEVDNLSTDMRTVSGFANGDSQEVVRTRLTNTPVMSIKNIERVAAGKAFVEAEVFDNKINLMATPPVDNDSRAIVIHDSIKENNGIYLASSGSWVYARYNEYIKNQAYIDKVLADDTAKGKILAGTAEPAIAFAFIDDDYNTGAAIDTLGNILAHNLDTRSTPTSTQLFALVDADDNTVAMIDKNGGLILSGATIEYENTGFNLVIKDAAGTPVLLIDKKGNLVTSNILRMEATIADLVENGGGSTSAAVTADYLNNNRSDIMHLFSYGQSLSRGAVAQPVISVSQKYDNLSFTSGVLPRANEADHDYTGFIPLVAKSASGNEGETPVHGLTDRMTEDMSTTDFSTSDWVFLASAPGQGGQPIANLEPGTLRWAGLVAQIEAGKNVANDLGKSYSVWGMAWAQGENDYGSNTTEKVYLQKLHGMHEEFCAQAMAITGQSFRPPMVTYQVVAHIRYSRNTIQIAMAQLKASHQYLDIIMATPIYHLPHAIDDLHLTADSSYQMGRYFATALSKSLATQTKFEPLQPTAIINQGNLIQITFNRSELFIDTTLVNAAPNLGFDIWLNDSHVDIIDTVTVDHNQVTIKLSSPAPTGSFITYAKGRVNDPRAAGPIEGPRGNIRDDYGLTDSYQDSTGTTRFMHNWCVIFEFPLTNKPLQEYLS